MTILDQIVADTRALVAERKRQIPIGRLEERRYFERSPADLAGALSADGLSVIAEVKKASPSQGVIRPDFEPHRFAAGYEAGGAAAVSVLTEPRHFQGSLADLERVAGEVAVPVLRKDFIIDEYQLFEARAHGASAVLLIAAVLDRLHLRDLHQAARGLGLSALVEVYDVGELDRIDFDEVAILGVNNRDLRTFEVDVDHSLRVFAEVPVPVVKVSESGLRSADDLAHLARHGVDAVLIGETLMRAPDPGGALARMLGDLQERLEATPD